MNLLSGINKIENTNRWNNWLFLLVIVLLLYGYLAALGTLPVDNRTDEGRRALVTAEMRISGDYFTPTLYAQPYLNKPPLYNWIIASSFHVLGSYSSFALRLPVIISLFIMGFCIYYFVKRYVNNTVALLSAITFLTNGRILIYDSLQGLIDISFGLIMYTSMMLVYHLDKKKKIELLFLITYFLTAIAFLMKGLSAVVCQGITLTIYFIYTKRIRLLFSLSHFTGILLFLIITGGYYLIYFQKNNFEPLLLFKKLLTESTDRTIVKFSIGDIILHVVTYPFKLLYHYAPWMILLVLLFRKGFYQKLNSNPFIFYNAVIFLSNFIIYWSSPEVYARYLFFILPLLFTVLTFFYYEYKNSEDWKNKFISYVFGGWLLLLPAVCLLFPFIKMTNSINYVWIKSMALCIAFVGVCLIFFKSQLNKILVFALALALMRIGFNWFVVDQRGESLRQLEKDASIISHITKNKPMYILSGSDVGNLDGFAFHLNISRNDILQLTDSIKKDNFYITDKLHLQNHQVKVFHEFNNEKPYHLYLVQFTQ